MWFDLHPDWDTDDGTWDWANPTTTRQYQKLVDGGPAAAHIHALQEEGWSIRQIDQATHVGRATLDRLARNTDPGRVHPDTERRILDVTGPPPHRPAGGRTNAANRAAALQRTRSSQTWLDRAACRGMDPDLFFPGQGDTHTFREAKAVCARCPVADECLDHALEEGERYGVWGGKGEKQRQRLRVRRAA